MKKVPSSAWIGIRKEGGGIIRLAMRLCPLPSSRDIVPFSFSQAEPGLRVLIALLIELICFCENLQKMCGMSGFRISLFLLRESCAGKEANQIVESIARSVTVITDDAVSHQKGERFLG